MKKIYRFVLTGGSCGGKTAATIMLKQMFEKLGYHVFIINEVSTELDKKGFTLEKLRKRRISKKDFTLADRKREYNIKCCEKK